MTSKNTTARSRWAKVRAPFAIVAAACFLGTAVIGPLTVPSGDADAVEMEFQARINQVFVPNVNPEDDLIYPDVVVDVSAAEKQRIEEEKAAEEAAKAAAAAAEEAAKKKSQSSDTTTTTPPPKFSGGGSPADWMKAAGIAESDWGFVDYIASRESGWNPNATNGSTGACGLIQAYPCSKVPGNGYDPVDNLRWASGYAVGRYGSWQAAYAFWTANHWW